MDSQTRKVKYVAGSGLFLQESLSDGQCSFIAGLTYTIANYPDFLRLTQHGDFVEVDDRGKEITRPAPRVVEAKPVEEDKKGKAISDKGEIN